MNFRPAFILYMDENRAKCKWQERGALLILLGLHRGVEEHTLLLLAAVHIAEGVAGVFVALRLCVVAEGIRQHFVQGAFTTHKVGRIIGRSRDGIVIHKEAIIE